MATKKKAKKIKNANIPVKRSKRYTRDKGHGFERDCAILLRSIYPNAKRHLENQKAEAMGFDLDNTGPFRFQCKRYKKYVNPSRIEEVQFNKNQMPALITKGDHKKPIVCLYLDDFIKILEDVGEAFVCEDNF